MKGRRTYGQLGSSDGGSDSLGGNRSGSKDGREGSGRRGGGEGLSGNGGRSDRHGEDGGMRGNGRVTSFQPLGRRPVSGEALVLRALGLRTSDPSDARSDLLARTNRTSPFYSRKDASESTSLGERSAQKV